jgi:hypothetical protein
VKHSYPFPIDVGCTMEEEALQFLYVISGGTLFLFFIWYLHCLYFSLINIKENDKCTSHVQQGYNTPLTWGGLHKLWGPPHMRGVLYPCCTCDVRESPLKHKCYTYIYMHF